MLRAHWFFAALLCPAGAYCADSPVVELFEDDTVALIPQLTMGGIGGSEDTSAAAELTDVFTGKAALRIAPSQRFNPDVKGWDYPIREKPGAGEYRYLRFAWKKVTDGPIMLQLHTRGAGADWHIRYFMGQNPPWQSKILAPVAPTEWQVVTCDVFKDFGKLNLGGVAFSPLEGSDGLFDHMLLGRTVEDLDRATAKAILAMPDKRMTESQLKNLWNQLANSDESKADTAVWAFVAGRKDALPFLTKTIRLPNSKAPEPVDDSKVKPLIEGLTHYRHLTREAAGEDLFRLGDGALPLLRKALEAADGTAKERIKAFLDQWTGRSGLDEVRLRRCVAILKSIGTTEAKELRTKLEKALP